MIDFVSNNWLVISVVFWNLILLSCISCLIWLLKNKYFNVQITNVKNDIIKTTPDKILDSIKNGSLEYQGRTVEFYCVVRSRCLSDSVSLHTYDEDTIRWYVDTQEKRDQGHEIYIPEEKYRFRLYIERIDYNNAGKHFIVWSKIVK